VTLAVAVWCPYPFNDESSVPKSGIVLGADTRYSFRDGRPPFDQGIKVIQLGRASACAFAGDTETAAVVCTHLSDVFARAARDHGPGVLDEEIDAALADAAAETRSHRSYAMLLAFVTSEGYPRLMALGPGENAIHVSKHGWGAMIGDYAAGDADAFEEALKGEIMRPRTLSRPFAPTSWMFPVGLAFDAFVRDRPRESVSNSLQLATVSFDGFFQSDILAWHRETGDLEIKTPRVSFD
jgi:hypothetical protein